MNPLAKYATLAKILAVFALAAAVVAGYLAWHSHVYNAGKAEIQGKWDKANAERAEAEKRAIVARAKENEQLARQREIDRQRIEKAHHDELAKVRADIARAPGLRVGPGICAGFASSTEAKGTSGSDGADSRTRLVREDIRRDIDALKLRVEEAFAAGRACQAFVAANGMGP